MSKSNSFKPAFNSKAYSFESEAWSSNKLVFGIDEVGRGAFAGPVVACCLVLNPFSEHKLLIDSKMLTENKLLEASCWIKKHSFYAFGVFNAFKIDELNIYRATQIAMERAYYALLTHPLLYNKESIVLIDAMPLSFSHKEIFSFPKGESRSVSIAAASIMAKVYRDDLMKNLSTSFSMYGFDKHKGYGTLFHQETLQKNGLSLIHRATFIPQSCKKEEKIIQYSFL